MSGFQEAFVSPLDSIRSSTEAVDPLGTLRLELNKMYKYVKLKLVPTADVDATAFDQLIYTNYSEHEVGIDIGDIEATNFLAGYTVAAIDMSEDKGKYLWMQIKGPVAIVGTAVTGGVAGKDFNGGTSDLTPIIVTTLTQRGGTEIGATEVLLNCPY